jgi:hypothetical protein
MICARAESNHELVELPSTAAATLARLRLLSCDASLLFANAGMFRAAAQRLQHLYIRWIRGVESTLKQPLLLSVQQPLVATQVQQCGSKHLVAAAGSVAGRAPDPG